MHTNQHRVRRQLLILSFLENRGLSPILLLMKINNRGLSPILTILLFVPYFFLPF